MAAIYRSRVMSYDNNGNGRATQTPPPPPPSSTSTDVTSAVTCTTSSVTSVDTTSTVSQRVRRRLFHDDPTDSNANAEIARIEMENIQRQQSQKYNFDFSRGIPINDPSGAYEWQQLTPTVSSIQYSGSEPTSTSEQIESIERPSIELTPIVIESPSTSGITSEGGSCSASTSSIWTTKATSMTSNTPPLLLTATTTYRSQPSLLGTYPNMPILHPCLAFHHPLKSSTNQRTQCMRAHLMPADNCLTQPPFTSFECRNDTNSPKGILAQQRK